MKRVCEMDEGSVEGINAKTKRRKKERTDGGEEGGMKGRDGLSG